MVKIDVLSKEFLKPLSYPPDHLRNYKLSLLDQLAPSFYVPIVLFYSAPQFTIQTNDIVEKLKKSLSETLVGFYPFAGKIRNDLLVEVLGDDGVLFVEARVNNTKLSEILKSPEMSSLHQLLPIDPYKVNNEEGVPVMAVQFNVFNCGGIGIGLCISHRVADATTLSTFLSAWAATTRNSSHGRDGAKRITPFLDLAAVFPPKEIHVQAPRNLIKRESVVTKRFLFNASSLAKLKAKVAASSRDDYNPTRVEAVTALICKTAMKSRNGRSSTEKNSRPSMVISHVVNLRGRMDPPLPETTIGNIWRCAVAAINVEEENQKPELHDLVVQLKKEIRKLDKDYVAKLQSEDGFLQAYESFKDESELVSEGVVPFYRFSSWVRFPLYETDFGWGNPIWACVTNVPIKDVVILMSTRSGDGIEAWINLEEEDMARFECDHELLQFASQAQGS